MRPGVKGTFTSTPPSLAAFSTAAQPPRTIRSASETFLPPLAVPPFAAGAVAGAAFGGGAVGGGAVGGAGFGRGVEVVPDRFELLQHGPELRRLIDLPVLLGREADARAVGAAALVRAAEGRCRRPGRRNQLRDR